MSWTRTPRRASGRVDGGGHVQVGVAVVEPRGDLLAEVILGHARTLGEERITVRS